VCHSSLLHGKKRSVVLQNQAPHNHYHYDGVLVSLSSSIMLAMLIFHTAYNLFILTSRALSSPTLRRWCVQLIYDTGTRWSEQYG